MLSGGQNGGTGVRVNLGDSLLEVLMVTHSNFTLGISVQKGGFEEMVVGGCRSEKKVDCGL